MKMMRRAREAVGLSMRELANLVGVSEGAISQYELGKRKPCLQILMKISDALGCTIDYLLNGAQDSDSASDDSSPVFPAACAVLPDECTKMLLERCQAVHLLYRPEEDST